MRRTTRCWRCLSEDRNQHFSVGVGPALPRWVHGPHLANSNRASLRHSSSTTPSRALAAPRRRRTRCQAVTRAHPVAQAEQLPVRRPLPAARVAQRALVTDYVHGPNSVSIPVVLRMPRRHGRRTLDGNDSRQAPQRPHASQAQHNTPPHQQADKLARAPVARASDSPAARGVQHLGGGRWDLFLAAVAAVARARPIPRAL